MITEIHFVTGKGGVGKSVVAAALAFKQAQAGKKVLLVELGDQSFFKDFFEISEVGFQPKKLTTNLDIALWKGETCLREYATYLIKVDSLAKIFFENSVMKAFINVAPALPELAIMGKITSGPRNHGPPLPYDVLVVDAYATGHFMALMEAPKGMAQAVKVGPMGEQSRSIDAVLRNEELCHYHVVSLPEELPMKEAVELVTQLNKEFGLKPELVLNKILPVAIPLTTVQKVSKEKSDLGQFAEYVEEQMQRQERSKAEALKISKKRQEISLMFQSEPWPLVRQIAEELK